MSANTTPFQPLSPEEILSGQSQGGVPRPSFLKDHEDDGTVQSVVPEHLREKLKN